MDTDHLNLPSSFKNLYCNKAWPESGDSGKQRCCVKEHNSWNLLRCKTVAQQEPTEHTQHTPATGNARVSSISNQARACWVHTEPHPCRQHRSGLLLVVILSFWPLIALSSNRFLQHQQTYLDKSEYLVLSLRTGGGSHSGVADKQAISYTSRLKQVISIISRPDCDEMLHLKSARKPCGTAAYALAGIYFSAFFFFVPSPNSILLKSAGLVCAAFTSASLRYCLSSQCRGLVQEWGLGYSKPQRIYISVMPADIAQQRGAIQQCQRHSCSAKELCPPDPPSHHNYCLHANIHALDVG